MKNIYSELKKKGIKNPSNFSEEVVVTLLKENGLYDCAELLRAYGGKKNYDRALRIYFRKNKDRIMVKIPLSEYKSMKRRTKAFVLVLAIAITSTSTAIIQNLNQKYTTVTLALDYGDSGYSIAEEFSGDTDSHSFDDEMLEKFNKFKIDILGQYPEYPETYQPYDPLDPDRHNTTVKITVPNDRLEDVEAHNDDLGFKDTYKKR